MSSPPMERLGLSLFKAANYRLSAACGQSSAVCYHPPCVQLSIIACTERVISIEKAAVNLRR